MAKARNNEIRQTILSVSLEQFLGRGYENVLMKDIAKECGISTSLLQHYYGKKEQILVHIVYDIVFKVCDYMYENLAEYVVPEDAQTPYIWFGMFYELFYSLLCSDNIRLLRLYKDVLFNADLLRRGIDITNEHVLSSQSPHYAASFNNGFIGVYLLNGCLSQLVAVYYRNNTLTAPISTILGTALTVYYNYCGLSGEQQREISEKIRALVTDGRKQEMHDYYMSKKGSFLAM